MPVLATAPRPDAVPRSLWGPVTVRVAWELVLAGVPVRPEVLAEAREHVLRGLPAGAGEVEAEELSSALVADWLGRVREGRYRRCSLDGDLSLPISAAWRHRLREALDPIGDVVLRMHHGDGFSLQAVARSAAIDPIALEVARGGIREAMRLIAVEEGLPVRGWPLARLDQLIGRVSRIAEPGCPGPGGLLTEEGRAHADLCPRCSRAVRLIRSGVLSPADLFPPDEATERLGSRCRVLALLLHPDGRRHRDALVAALGEQALYVGGEAWLVAETELDELRPRLEALALAGTPARHLLRGSLVTGSGRWIGRRLIGPLPLEAVEAARARTWGEVDGLGELPLPLPPPPRATPWWAAAMALVGLAVATAAWLGREPPPVPTYPVQARVVPAEQGAALRFDTDELAVVDVVVRRAGRLEILEQGVREGKGRWATGDGDYRLPMTGEEALLVSSPRGVDALESRVAAARASADPLASLAQGVQAADPVASVWRSPGPSGGWTP